MGGIVQCGGADVVAGRISMAIRGAWWADLKLDTQTIPSGSVSIVAQNGINITGTVIKAGQFIDSVFVHVAGGGGGTGHVLAPASYQNALLRDPLNSMLTQSGETMSATISSNITSLQMPFWTINGESLSHALDDVCSFAGRTIGQTVNWRMLPDGTTWIGVETWPAQTLPVGSDVTWMQPVGPRFELGVMSPSLIPGISLSDLGVNVSGTDHWIDHDSIRTWVWTA